MYSGEVWAACKVMRCVQEGICTVVRCVWGG